jgi:hypothetical protein
VVLKMEDQGQHGMAAQQDAARHYQPVLEVNRDIPRIESQLFSAPARHFIFRR